MFLWQEFATHLLFSSPRLRFSQAQQRAVLAWAKTLGATNVPSMYALEKMRSRISMILEDPTERFDTPSGNTFYLNAISKAIALVSNMHPLESLTDEFIVPGFCQSTNAVHHARLS